ncbi:MAG: hypothetical protein JNL06_19495 [Alphaproteobacteria bacterium]|nr:hypothetical protein [Alphaproteobacteria bacterium]
MAARRPPRRKSYVLWLGAPTALVAGAFAYVADHPMAAGAVGAVVGFFIGLAMLAFPNLDRGGPDDNEDGFIH